MLGKVQCEVIRHFQHFYVLETFHLNISDAKEFNVVTTNKNIQIPWIQERILVNNGNFYYVLVNDIIEKYVHPREEKSNIIILFRYPNLDESS